MYYTKDYLSIVTEEQYWAIIKYTQDHPDTEFRIICFCGHSQDGRMMLWRGPERYHTFFKLIA